MDAFFPIALIRPILVVVHSLDLLPETRAIVV